MSTPRYENLDERVQFRSTRSEKETLYRLAGPHSAKWLRWGMQQAIKKLQQQSKKIEK